MAPTPLILADDLSGAAEAAAALGAGSRPALHLWPHLPATATARPVVLDLDSRHVPAAEAQARVRAALSAVTDSVPILTKIDSLLRGNIAAQVAPLVGANRIVVFTPALPPQQRTVVDGVLYERGVPMHLTPLWALEPNEPPTTVAQSLGDLPVHGIPVATVRSAHLAQALRETAGSVAVCDAETQADLEELVAAGFAACDDPRFVGSAALARALAPRLRGTENLPAPTVAPRPGGGVLYVLGTGSQAATEQSRLLAEGTGARVRALGPDELVRLTDDDVGTRALAWAEDLRQGSLVVRVKAVSVPGVSGTDIVAALARLVRATVAAAVGWPVRLVLTGGQTARAVLDALGCRSLELVCEVHPGAVLLTSDDGLLVATRPGSHGGRDSLVQIHEAMYAHTQHQENP